MKRILHHQQMGNTPYNLGDWIVQGRDEFHEDLQLHKVVGTWGHKPDAAKRLWGIPFVVGSPFDFDFSQPSGVIGDDTAADFSPANY